MTTKSWIPAITLSILFLGVAFYFGHKVYEHAEVHREIRNENLKVLFLKERLGSKSEWANGLKLKEDGSYQTVKKGVNILKKYILDDMNWSERKEASKKLNTKATMAYENSIQWAYYELYLAIGFITLSCLIYFNSPLFKPALAYTLIIIALAALVIGLFTPMLEIEAYLTDFTVPTETLDLSLIEFQKTFEGRVYLQYENKSLAHLVVVLFNDGNFAVGITILMFSIVVPLAKLLLSLMTIFSKGKANNVVHFIIHKLAKWSMLDVFVVAMFLAYLSFNSLNPGTTFSSTLVGLYFFMAYCMLSIASSYFINTRK